MLRFAVIAILTFGIRIEVYAQEPFHWEMTSGPGESTILSFEVAPNGDYCVLSTLYPNSYGALTHFFRRSGSQWHTVHLPILQYQNQMTFGSHGSPIILLDTGLLRINANGTTTRISSSRISQLHSDRHGNLITVVNQRSIEFSSDEGDSWTTLPSPPLKVESSHKDSLILAAIFDDDIHRYFVSTDSCLYVSSDRGYSWPITALQDYAVKNFVLGHNGTVWAITPGIGTGDGIARSTDSGRTWKSVRAGLYYSANVNPSSSSQMAVDRNNLAVTASSNSSVAFIVDTVIPLGSLNLYPSQPSNSAVTLDSSGNWYAYFENIAPLMYSSSGLTSKWQPFDAIPGSNVAIGGGYGYTPTVIALPYGLIAWTYVQYGGGCYFSSDRGDHWRKFQSMTDTSTPNAIASVQLKDNRYLGISTTGTTVISDDNQKSWKYIKELGSIPPQGIVIHGDTIYYTYNDEYFASRDSLYRSTDAGATWQSPFGIDHMFTDALGVDSSGILYRSDFSRVNTYADWGQKELNFTTVGGYIDRIFVAGPSEMLTADQDGLTYRTIDSGKTWQPLPLPWQCDYITRSDDILMASGNHVKCMYRGSNDVIDVSMGLDSDQITWIDQDPSGTIYLGTAGSGVWRSSGDIHHLALRASPVEHAALLCYPNPATTFISIAGLPPNLHSVEAFDLLADRHVIERIGQTDNFDLRSLQPGVYCVTVGSEHMSAMFIISR